MTTLSEILYANPIGKALDAFRDAHALNPTEARNQEEDRGRLKNTLVDLILALQSLSASRALPSKRGNTALFNDLGLLNSAIFSDQFHTARVRPLLDAVVNRDPDEVIWAAVYDAVTESTPLPRPTTPPPRLTISFPQTPWLRNTSSFANTTEYRKYVDDVLKEELGRMYVGVPYFFDAFFGKIENLEPAAQAVFDRCRTGNDSLYRECGWQGWPEQAKEKDVLSWFAKITDQLWDFAEEHTTTSRARRRPLAQPHQPLQGSTAERKLDVGFVDDPSAGVDSKCHWKQILVPGELKSNPAADVASKAWLDLGRYAREVLAAQDSRRFVLGFTLCGSRMRLWNFDRLGGIASSCFDINEDGLQFVSAILGFLWLNEEQLGFDPTIITTRAERYIEIKRDDCTERLILDQLIKRVRCIAGRATTCWKAHREGDESRTPLVIKDSWQYPEREQEGELLREAAEKGVINVARYYYHETVRVGTQDDSVHGNIRRGLDVTDARHYKAGSAMPPLSTTIHSLSRDDRSRSAARRKRSSSCTNAFLPPKKRTYSSSLVEEGRGTADRVHRRVIVRDFGKPIYMASSKASLLAALEGCIAGYESLYTRAGMLQCDISPNNLMVNEDEDNPSWYAFLIDLDLAIKEDREKSSGARGKTGTRAFMAIGILYGDKPHSFMHDLESFFWVLFWICIHYDGSEGRVVERFDKWNYANTEDLAMLKLGIVSDDEIFRQITLKHFTDYYQPLVPCVSRLQRKIFPGGRRWRVPNPELYDEMREILRTARDELNEVER